MEDIISKYPEFGYLTANNKIVFRFNSTDAFICERLGHFIYEAFSLRNESFFRYKNCKLTAFATLILYFFLLLFLFFAFVCNNT